MKIISVKNLSRTFKKPIRDEGLKGMIKALFSRKYEEVKAVDDISFEIKDGWDYDIYYKIELNNISVQVMNNEPELICFVLNRFNCLTEEDEINLYSGECGIIEDTGKYYLKLWIRHPNVFGSKVDVNICEYKFDGIDVTLSDDYDDSGMLYIKFLADSISVAKL